MKQDDALTKWVASRIGYIIIIAALIMMMGITVQSSFQDRTVVEEEYRNELIENAWDTSVVFNLNSGAGKPFIKHDGTTVTEITGWGSDIYIDGSKRSLWHTTFNFNSYENNTIFYTRGGPDWQLVQRTTAYDKKVVTEYYFISKPDASIDSVKLRLAHVRWYYDRVQIINNQTAKFKVSDNNQSFQGTIRANKSKGIRTKKGSDGPNVISFHYETTNVTGGREILVAREVITYREYNK